MDTFDHAAKVGRERGRESPIPVSPAMATLAGRIAASTKLCTAISATAVPTTAPKIPYWTSRDPVAPAIAPTTTNSSGGPDSVATTARTTAPPSPGVGGLQCRRPIDLVAGRPLLHKAAPAQAGKNDHVHQHQHGDNGDGGRLDVAIGLLESDNEKRRKRGRPAATTEDVIAQIAHEYLAPYRSHAHCQMRSMPRH